MDDAENYLEQYQQYDDDFEQYQPAIARDVENQHHDSWILCSLLVRAA